MVARLRSMAPLAYHPRALSSKDRAMNLAARRVPACAVTGIGRGALKPGRWAGDQQLRNGAQG